MKSINKTLDAKQSQLTSLETEKHIVSMLIESTGTHMLDSGGSGGRQWQRTWKAINGGSYDAKPDHDKALAYFRAQPAVTVDEPFCYKVHAGKPCDGSHDSRDVDYRVNVFAYLREVLSLDAVCREYNARFVPAKDWDGGEIVSAYGLSRDAAAWISERFTVGETFNTYNGESTLSHVLQGTLLKLNDGTAEQYVLLQIHNGADVRGGYTDARLFTVPNEYINSCPDVSGAINDIRVTSRYDGYTLRREDAGGHDDHIIKDITCTPRIELDMDEVS